MTTRQHSSRNRQCREFAIAISVVLLWGCTLTSRSDALSDSVTPDSVDLSAQKFLTEFAHSDPQRRASARLYMLGVLDATEGKSWCSYKQLSTAALNEFVFEYFKKQQTAQLKRRASVVIEEALRNTFPCKAGK